jgi:transcriptional regulator with XRE-family HTH domain
MALTPFGKALRRIRIDRDMLLKEMADKAKLTPAFLSAVEAGRKSIPSDFVERIVRTNGLNEQDRDSLRQAADVSASSVSFNLSRMSSTFDRSLAVQLARNFDELDDERKRQIKNIMDRRKT